MRILAIRGKNLASLRGEFAIELNQPPLEQAGLFAITGHTGAGKSTLLDALCLALFDKMPRLIGSANVKVGRSDEDEKERISSNDVGSILSRGTAGAYAQVDFIGMDKQVYQAHWEVKRARNKVDGRLQKQSVTLKNLNTDAKIGQNKGDTLEEISDRIGLNFEQFRRSVLLAQGDFSAFLKARSDERSGLLERITGTEIYSQLSIAAYRQFQDEEQALNRIREKLAFEIPLETAQRQDLQMVIFELEDKFHDTQKSVEKNKALLDWFLTREQLAKEKNSTTSILEQLKLERDNNKVFRNELDQIISVQPLRALENTLEEMTTKCVDLDKQISQVKSENEQAKESEVKLNDSVQKTQQLLKIAETEFQKIKPELLQARELDTQIKLAHKECVIQEAQCKEINEELKTLNKKIINIDETKNKRQTIEQTITELNEHLKKLLAERKNISLEKLIQEKEATDKALKNTHGASDIYQAFISNQTKLEERKSEFEKANKNILETSNMIADKEQEKLKISVSLEEAKRALIIMQESVTQGAQSLRSLLKEEQACPVCGSLEHPWANQEAQLNKQYQQQKERVDTLEKSMQNCFIGLNQKYEQKKHIAAEKEKIAQQSDKLQAELVILEKQWHEAVIDIDLISQLSDVNNNDFFKSKIDKLNSILETLKRQEKQVVALQNEIDSNQKKKEQSHRELQALNAIISEQQVLSKQIDILVKQQKKSEDELEKRQKQEKNLSHERQKIFSGKDADSVEQNKMHAIAVLSKQLDSEQQSFKEVQQQQISSAQQYQFLQQQFDNTQIQKKTSETRLLAELQKRSLSRGKLSQLLQKDEDWIQAKQNEFDAQSNRMIKAETLLAERISKLQQHEQLIHKIDDDLHETDHDFLSEQTLKKQWQAQQEIRQTLQSELQEKRVELKHDDARKQRMIEFREELETQEQRWQQWGELNELIGSASGNKFRIFAQSLTLESLLAHANTHLNDFARRYQLQRVPGTDLELQIMDRDMADEIRSVQSLSGGESFLVSLALALGLASLSSNKTQVESLFIDEGFGTLDQETLDIAIASLDTLQGLGRKVGIISHVPILVERIGTRVVVKKMGGGQSRVVVEH